MTSDYSQEPQINMNKTPLMPPTSKFEERGNATDMAVSKATKDVHLNQASLSSQLGFEAALNSSQPSIITYEAFNDKNVHNEGTEFPNSSQIAHANQDLTVHRDPTFNPSRYDAAIN